MQLYSRSRDRYTAGHVTDMVELCRAGPNQGAATTMVLLVATHVGNG